MAKAQNFTVQDHNNNTFELSSLKGKKVLLSFFRYAGCPLCNMHISYLRNKANSWKEQGLVIVGVFQSPVSELSKYANDKNFPFLLLADPNEKIYEKYDVTIGNKLRFSLTTLLKLLKAIFSGHLPGKMNGSLKRVPADFLLDEELNIIIRYDGIDIGDHINLQEVEKFIERARNV